MTGRFVTRQVDEIVRVSLPGGIVFEATPVHPIWSVDSEDWVRADDLTPGERLLGDDGSVPVLSRELHCRRVPVFNLEVHGEHVYQVANLGILVHNADGGPCNLVSVITRPDGSAIDLNAPRRAADLPWGRIGARQAAKAIEAGQTSIRVASRDDAAEVVWRMFSSNGFINTTGRTGSDVRKILGSKAGTYHWDDVLDAAGKVAGHGADNLHGAMRHVQIHLKNGDIIRIFFP